MRESVAENLTGRVVGRMNEGMHSGGVTMKPKTKILGLLFGLLLPYFALVMYFVMHIQSHPNEQPFPTWFPYFGMAYFLGTILLVSAVSRRFARSAEANSAPQVKPRPAVRIAIRAWAGYLIAVWCIFLLYGAVETVRGKFEWQRALPAGAFLLTFIVLFARWLYTDIKTQQPPDKQGNS